MEIPSIDRMGQVNLPFSEEMAFQLGESNSNARWRLASPTLNLTKDDFILRVVSSNKLDE